VVGSIDGCGAISGSRILAAIRKGDIEISDEADGIVLALKAPSIARRASDRLITNRRWRHFCISFTDLWQGNGDHETCFT
jgi:hypothetical protein